MRNMDNGAELVDKTVNAMDEIRRNVDEVRTLVTDITEASREQATGIAQVSSAVAELDEITRDTVAQVGHAARAAASQEEQAEGLTELIARFRLGASVERQADIPHRRHKASLFPRATIRAWIFRERTWKQNAKI